MTLWWGMDLIPLISVCIKAGIAISKMWHGVWKRKGSCWLGSKKLSYSWSSTFCQAAWPIVARPGQEIPLHSGCFVLPRQHSCYNECSVYYGRWKCYKVIHLESQEQDLNNGGYWRRGIYCLLKAHMQASVLSVVKVALHSPYADMDVQYTQPASSQVKRKMFLAATVPRLGPVLSASDVVHCPIPEPCFVQ